jgi:hypothetical protein
MAHVSMSAQAEYRLWVTVPDLPLDAEELWTPFSDWLERNRGSLGPILSWVGDGSLNVVLATDADDEAAASQGAVEAVTSALHATGLGDRSPLAVDAGRVDEPVAA